LVVARSEISVVRWVGGWPNNSQLKCSSRARVRADVCGRALLWRNTTPDVSITPFVQNCPTQFFYCFASNTPDITFVPCCMYSTISTPFLPQKTVAISFLVDVCLNFFDLSGECVCNHCFDCSLVSTFTNETQVSWPVSHMM
jgi:hypothetical protein